MNRREAILYVIGLSNATADSGAFSRDRERIAVLTDEALTALGVTRDEIARAPFPDEFLARALDEE